MNLINNENLHEGRYLERSTKLTGAISPVIDLVRATLARGAATGDFRADVDALDFYVTLAAMGYYLFSNRLTLKAFVGRDYTEPSVIEAVTEMHVRMLIAYLQPAVARRIALSFPVTMIAASIASSPEVTTAADA